jgi:NADH-quinone oxidoreductase subunit L
VGVLAISGIPPFSGFWTKDAVQASLFESGTWYGPLLWAVGGATALLTAIYMFRVWFKTFTGEKRWAEDAHPHESPWTMALPLVVLAFFAAVIGFIEIPGASALHAWLKPVFGSASPSLEMNPLTVALLVGSAAVAFIGAGIGWFLWSKSDADTRRDLEMRPGLPPLVNAVRHKFWVDEALQKGIEKPGWQLTGVAETIDQSGVDAVAMKGVGAGLERLGGRFSRFENGKVRTYAGVILGGVVLMIGYVVVRGGLG